MVPSFRLLLRQYFRRLNDIEVRGLDFVAGKEKSATTERNRESLVRAPTTSFCEAEKGVPECSSFALGRESCLSRLNNNVYILEV